MRPLTIKQFRVARMIGKGHTTKEISLATKVSEQCIKNQIHEIFLKTGARDRVQLALWMNQKEFLDRLLVAQPKGDL